STIGSRAPALSTGLAVERCASRRGRAMTPLSTTDIPTPTILVCGILAPIIAGSTPPPSKLRPVHLLFAPLPAAIRFWYLSQSLFSIYRNPIWQTIIALLTVLLPQFALHLFEAMVPHEPGRPRRLLRFAGALGVPMLLLVLVSRTQPDRSAGIPLFLYVFVLV